MKLQVLAILDRAVAAYGRPIFVPTNALAMRSFEDEVNRVDVNNPMNVHPNDFALFVIGSYDEETGRFENLDVPFRLSEASDILRGGLNETRKASQS